MINGEQLELYKRAVIMVKDGYRKCIAAKECRIDGKSFVRWYELSEKKGYIIDGVFNDEVEIKRVYNPDPETRSKLEKGCEYMLKGYSFNDAAALSYANPKSLYSYFCKKHGSDAYAKIRNSKTRENLRTMEDAQYQKILQAIDCVLNGDDVSTAAKKCDISYSRLQSYITRKRQDIYKILHDRKYQAKIKQYQQLKIKEKETEIKHDEKKEEKVIVNSVKNKMINLMKNNREILREMTACSMSLNIKSKPKIHYTSFTTGGCSGMQNL